MTAVSSTSSQAEFIKPLSKSPAKVPSSPTKEILSEVPGQIKNMNENWKKITGVDRKRPKHSKRKMHPYGAKPIRDVMKSLHFNPPPPPPLNSELPQFSIPDDFGEGLPDGFAEAIFLENSFSDPS